MVLAAAVLFQICFTDYLSWFALVLAVCLPLLSLAASLPLVRGCSLSLSAAEAAVERGGRARWVLTFANAARLPLPRITFTLGLENLLTGERITVRRSLPAASRGARTPEEIPAPHCGTWVCAVFSPRVCDLLGLFSFRLPPPPPCRVLVLPVPTREDPPPGMDRGAEGAGMKPRPGGGPGEDYDLRAYRPGDPLRAVHWKLSSKRDELIVREGVQPQDTLWNLTFDHFGAPEVFERVLDRLYTVGSVLLTRGQRMLVQWAEPSTGAVRCMAVSDEASFLAALDTLLRDPAPGTGRSICESLPDAGAGPDAALRIHIDAGEEDAPCQS